MEDKPKYISQAALKNRNGWSQKTINHYLPQPDHLAVNPYYRSAAPSKLYLLSRIETIEQQPDWQQQAMLINKKKGIASKATDTKRAKLMNYVESVKIEVPIFEQQELTKKACSHYNARQAQREFERGEYSDWNEATPESDKPFLNRITTNYLRHKLTCYERELDRLSGKVGIAEAYTRLKERVNQAIYIQYPFLNNQ
ncbi:hypothetical protein [Spirosoma aerolatum]|uniref:hypothetical protein n=1 Tax=Spirosoma aerolatum TaxID=1211326 RepID=UPI0009ABF41D|nr:hypothetical protein [Spirosoma aerolatum]